MTGSRNTPTGGGQGTTRDRNGVLHVKGVSKQQASDAASRNAQAARLRPQADAAAKVPRTPEDIIGSHLATWALRGPLNDSEWAARYGDTFEDGHPGDNGFMTDAKEFAAALREAGATADEAARVIAAHAPKEPCEGGEPKHAFVSHRGYAPTPEEALRGLVGHFQESRHDAARTMVIYGSVPVRDATRALRSEKGGGLSSTEAAAWAAQNFNPSPGEIAAGLIDGGADSVEAAVALRNSGYPPERVLDDMEEWGIDPSEAATALCVER